MKTPRFYCALLDASEIELDEKESRHARTVLRVRPGDRMILFNGTGVEALCEVVKIGRRIYARILEKRKVARELPIETVCAAATPKGDRLDFMIQKLAELGLAIFIPLRCERSVAHIADKKRLRLERIALEASKQCGRNRSLQIRPEHSLSEILQPVLPGTLFAAIPGASQTLLDVLGRHRPTTFFYLIGPEGGFTTAEEGLLEQVGAVAVSLGPTILRVETAALAFQSILSGSIRTRPSEDISEP